MMSSIADRIRQRLTELNKSAAGASLEAGLGRSAVQNILSGASESPRVSTLQKLTVSLDCSLEYLLGKPEYASFENGYEDPFMPSLSRLKASVGEYAYIVEVGAFRADPAISYLEIDSVVLHHDLRLRKNNVGLYVLNDNSNQDKHFLKGDLLFVAAANEDEPLELFNEASVIIERRLMQPGLSELSLRSVWIDEHNLALGTGLSTSAGAVISFPRGDRDPRVGDEFVLPDGSEVTIVGLVVRISRQLSVTRTIWSP